MLPLSVLKRAADEMLCYGESGMSVCEMSHRSADFEPIIEKAEADLRRLMNIPDSYAVLFLQGGASTQFASVPLNLLNEGGTADYIVSGQFSGKAYTEAQKYGEVTLVATSKADGFSYIPTVSRSDINADASYLHICYNNTIFGTKYNYIPDTGEVTLVADMSSCIASEPIDVTKFGVIYAGAQKNIAPAGLTIVIVRRDLLGHARPDCPSMLNWSIMAENGSMYNTPPCFAIYMAGLVFEWLLDMGGLDVVGEKNREKADLLYSYLDSQSYYIAPVRRDCRSIMNVTFVTGDAELDKLFAAEAQSAGLKNLKGHRSVGGMRASIYNAMPREGVLALTWFMEEFAKKHPKA